MEIENKRPTKFILCVAQMRLLLTVNCRQKKKKQKLPAAIKKMEPIDNMTAFALVSIVRFRVLLQREHPAAQSMCPRSLFKKD